MSILSWILCYFGIGSEEGDIREEEREEREAREGKGSGRSNTRSNPPRTQNNRSTNSNKSNRGAAHNSSSATSKRQEKRTVTLVANNGDEIDFTCYGIVDYRGKSYACMELIDSDDDGVLFFEYTVTRGGEESYSMVDDDRLIDKLLAEANRVLSK